MSRVRATPGLAALAVAMLGAGALVWNASYAAFSDTTTNPGNSWATGSVSITNDQSSSAVFSVTGVKPDSASSTLNPPGTGAFTASSASSGGSACIKVTYSGTTAANIKLYASVNNIGADGGLGQYLLFDVDTGTDTAPGTDVSCATYTSVGYLHGSASNTNVFVNSLPSTYGTGLAGWNGVTGPVSKWYRFSWLLPANVASAAQSETVQVTLTWEAQNT